VDNAKKKKPVHIIQNKSSLVIQFEGRKPVVAMGNLLNMLISSTR